MLRRKNELMVYKYFRSEKEIGMDRLIDNLNKIGIDTEGVLHKLGGNEVVYISICKKFLSDINYIMFIASMEANDMNLAGMYIHTLKGVASNLGFNKMSYLCNEILTDIKDNDLLFLHYKLQELTDEYNRIVDVLKQ